MTTITLYESNAGHLFIARDGDETYYDMTDLQDVSSFDEDAAALAAGETADWTVDTYRSGEYDLRVGEPNGARRVAEYKSETGETTLDTNHLATPGHAGRRYLRLHSPL
jgi:hypothetical protein